MDSNEDTWLLCGFPAPRISEGIPTWNATESFPQTPPVACEQGSDLLTSQLYAVQTSSVLPTLALASSEAGREFF